MRAEKARNALTKKGFKERRKRDHYSFYFFFQGNKTRIHTKFSHQRQIPPNILDKMRRQMRLKEPGQLEEFLSCDMGEVDYQAILLVQGVIG